MRAHKQIEWGDYEYGIPGFAELHTFHHYRTSVKRPSQFAIGQTYKSETGVNCPSCKTLLPNMEHGTYTQCGNCRLQMQLFGNGLWIWRGQWIDEEIANA